ncbi:MAG: serine protease, partial [Minisyncoccia bacterium]
MARISPHFGIIYVLFIGVCIVVFSNSTFVPSVGTIVATIASSTPRVAVIAEATTSIPSTPLPQSLQKQVTSIPEKKVTSPIQAPSIAASTKAVPVPLSQNVSLDTPAATLRAALVNIICDVPLGSGLGSISGSGVFIDPKGIILTNAHIAQYFLLRDRNVSCVIRSGSPAIGAYKAELIYISSAWIHANAKVLTQTAPVGTGEYDFAFLAVTQSVTKNPLPSSFPFIALSQVPPTSGAPVVIASYGAQFLDMNQIQSSLFPTIVFGSIKDVFTFATNTVDVLDLGGSAAAQEGSSGGGVADASGILVGTITTSTIHGPTDTRSLGAITASYIRSDYESETGKPFDRLLVDPLSTTIADFALQIPALESVIV